MHRMKLLGPSCLVLALLAFLFFAAYAEPIAAAEEDPKASSSKKVIDTRNFQAHQGFFSFYWDEENGRVWLQAPPEDQPFLYVSSLATGLGSNPVGLDRGQLGSERVVRFHRVGPRIFLIQENLKYRATSDNAVERRAVAESFAESVVWSGKLERSDQGDTLVDITDFLMRDAHDCIGTLSSSGQGSYALDTERSYVYLPRTKAFPDNTEFEVALTLSSKNAGGLANRVAADGKSITLRQHHSLVRLPDANYRPRAWDPRVGCFSTSYSDYGQPIDLPLEKHWITRHRLEKTNPQAPISPAKEPIVYYVDPGAPPPVREALIEGASWWNQAFEAAGFENAFEVRVLPDDADPMDVRYNVIQWVHRATRGWSYGQSVTDPRTGEIIKGHVLLGSLRVRQDHLLFENLIDDSESVASRSSHHACICGMEHIPEESYLSQLDSQLTSTEVALARIRQLSAHEVGHTLGFAHNFAASTYADRASVMDYPAPRVKISAGALDLSDAYAVGIGEWDKFAVRYAYSQFSEDTEQEQLAKLIEQAIEKGFLYVTDADARPAGAAHPLGNLWDNGAEPVEALRHEMRVRRLALDQFGPQVLADGQPLAELEKAFVPLYLHHRYQVDAAAKVVGGYHYTYAVKGDGQTPLQAVPIAQQKAALQALLDTIRPAELIIPENILQLLVPQVVSSASDRERFDSRTSPMFDATTAMRAAAELTLGNLLQPQRASRLAQAQTSGNDKALGLSQVCSQISSFLGIGGAAIEESAAEGEARRIAQSVYVDKLIELAEHPRASHDARACALHSLKQLNQFADLQLRLSAVPVADSVQQAHWLQLRRTVDRFLNQPYPQAAKPDSQELPPGSPIGNR